MRPSAAGPVGQVARVAAVALAVVALVRLGHGPLSLPADRSLGGFDRWYEERGAAVLAMAVVRFVGLGLAGQQLGALALALVGHVLRLPDLVRWAEAATLPALRITAARVVAGGLAAGTVLVPAAAGAAPSPVPVGTATIVLVVPPGGSGQATIRLLPPTPTPPAAPPPIAVPEPASSAGTGSPGPWTVARGDHLWSIAVATLEEAGRDADDDEAVGRYWRDLVLANPELVDADLIFPGQTIVRPPLP